jgi:hypothetical protein
MTQAEPGHTEKEEEGPAPTPFDNPFFLPVLLWLFTAWFFWDAWIEPLEEWLRFNRYGFGFLLGLAIHGSIQAARPLPFLFAGLMVVYAVWLGYMGFVGPQDAWYSGDPLADLFNRWGSGFFVLAAGVSAFRESRRQNAAQ